MRSQRPQDQCCPKLQDNQSRTYYSRTCQYIQCWVRLERRYPVHWVSRLQQSQEQRYLALPVLIQRFSAYLGQQAAVVTKTALPSPTGNAMFTGVCDVLVLTWVGQLQPLGQCYLFYRCLRCFSAYLGKTAAAAKATPPSLL